MDYYLFETIESLKQEIAMIKQFLADKFKEDGVKNEKQTKY